MIQLNHDFAGTGLQIQFQPGETKRIESPGWFTKVSYTDPTTNNAEQNGMKSSLHRGGPQDLNIYTVGFVSTPGVQGYATFPFDYTSSSSGNDGIVLYYGALPGGDSDTNTGKYLFYTFEGGCYGQGDYVDDTHTLKLEGSLGVP
ncbi:hypothetical protein PLICRDRAFT_26422 [Plicaturopsis crispa FD-325 SS-3]|nr:hypothetical protein PLICRDRAFT_26422 [Plicaturopsis crispa FD-325 SS-3]